MHNEVPIELFGLVALTIAALATTIWSTLQSKGTKVQERLEALTNRPAAGLPISVMTDEEPKRPWERLLIWLGRRQADGQELARTNNLRTLLNQAGFRRASAIYLVLGIRAVLMFGVPLCLAPLVFSRARLPTSGTALFAVVFMGFGFLFPTIVIGRLASIRRTRITAGLPDVLDLIVLCVESGLGLHAAITRVADDRADTRDPLGQELAQLANELRVGVPRRDALRNLATRTGSEDLRSLVGHLIQSERLGGNIGVALRAQADTSRAQRKLRAEEIANRMPVKMLLPTVMFMPALFLVIFVPVALHAMAVLSGG